jgi:hypothetical protein
MFLALAVSRAETAASRRPGIPLSSACATRRPMAPKPPTATLSCLSDRTATAAPFPRVLECASPLVLSIASVATTPRTNRSVIIDSQRAAMLKSHDRSPYSPIIKRPDFTRPNGKRLVGNDTVFDAINTRAAEGLSACGARDGHDRASPAAIGLPAYQSRICSPVMNTTSSRSAIASRRRFASTSASESGVGNSSRTRTTVLSF